jgi:hypothetical protein
MNRLMRPTLLAFVVSLVVWGLVAVWDADPSAVSSWMLTWQRIAVDVAVVSGLVMLARLVYATWERLTRWCRSASGCTSRIGEPHLRRVADRLRGGSNASGRAHRHAAGGPRGGSRERRPPPQGMARQLKPSASPAEPS